jgi:hypothetical protein
LRRTEVVVVVVWQLRPFSLGGCAIAIVCRVEQVRKVLEGGGSTEVMGLRALYHRMLGLGYVALLCAGPPEGREGQAPEMAQWARSDRIAEIGDVNQ